MRIKRVRRIAVAGAMSALALSGSRRCRHGRRRRLHAPVAVAVLPGRLHDGHVRQLEQPAGAVPLPLEQHPEQPQARQPDRHERHQQPVAPGVRRQGRADQRRHDARRASRRRPRSRSRTSRSSCSRRRATARPSRSCRRSRPTTRRSPADAEEGRPRARVRVARRPAAELVLLQRLHLRRGQPGLGEPRRRCSSGSTTTSTR